jgi:serine/threonine protein kinase
VTSASQETLSSSRSDLIDRLCDEFESSFRKGSQPRIEDFLLRVSETAARNALLRELIALELDLRHTPGETLPFAPYYQRFPEAAAVLDALRAEWEDDADPADGAPASPANRLEETVALSDAPQHFRHFELKSILGKGGFGIVWHARDLKLQRDVAIKFPRGDKLAEIDKSLFLREARAAANLRHGNIVSVYEVNNDDRDTYIVSELVDGLSLKTTLQTKTFSARDTATLVAKLADALQHAHSHGIVHRDLKPANVLVDAEGEPHIADFGLAKREAAEESISVAGHIMGTPTYMSPEQASGNHRAIDARTDIYALGVILYELLSELRHQIQHAAPAPPRSVKPDIPKDLEAICLKCLEKDRAKRYPTAKALADDLHLFLNEETLRGIPVPLHDRTWKWLRKRRRQVLLTAAAVLLAALSAGILVWSLSPEVPPTELQTVEFTTEPKGCEITVVLIDPATGEPDATKIQKAKGYTPLTMKLAPGDYLVVAVLASDEKWFHEVCRRVPGKDAGIPFSDAHLYWHLKPNGVIESRSITIPRPDVTDGMALVEGTTHLEELDAKGSFKQSWQLPAFYVDRTEVEPENKADSQPNALDAISTLAKSGKRLPSAAELYYLTTIVCPQDTCVLPDQTRLEGVHSGNWEWTSTKPGGPFSAIFPLPTVVNEITGGQALMIGGGAPDEAGGVRTPTGFRFAAEHKTKVAGIRGVRSVKPRRTPQDFARPAGVEPPQGP